MQASSYRHPIIANILAQIVEGALTRINGAAEARIARARLCRGQLDLRQLQPIARAPIINIIIERWCNEPFSNSNSRRFCGIYCVRIGIRSVAANGAYTKTGTRIRCSHLAAAFHSGKVEKWTEKQWGAAQKKWSKDKAKWVDCRNQSKRQTCRYTGNTQVTKTAAKKAVMAPEIFRGVSGI